MDTMPAQVVSIGSGEQEEYRKHLSSNRKRRSQAAFYVWEGWCAEWLVPKLSTLAQVWILDCSLPARQLLARLFAPLHFKCLICIMGEKYPKWLM